MDADRLGYGFGDGGRRSIFGFNAAGVAGTGGCCCGGRGDIEAAATVAGRDWSGAFEMGGGCWVEDVAEGTGEKTHSWLE